MDLRMFYQKLRKIEEDITDPHVVVVSQETADGGRAGQKSEVSRSIAARSLLEGRARLATPEEAAEYRKTIDQALQDAPNVEAAVTVVEAEREVLEIDEHGDRLLVTEGRLGGHRRFLWWAPRIVRANAWGRQARRARRPS